MTEQKYKPYQVTLAVIAAVVMVLAYLIWGTDEISSMESEPSGSGRARASVLEAIESERRVSSASWEGSKLRVGVADDGSRRDGYAAYLCEVVREHGATPAEIAVQDSATGITLGYNSCD